MSISSLSILVAALLPYAGTVLAKSRMPLRANAAPREHVDRESGWRKRAGWAERNGFEAFPLFAAAVLVALHNGASDAAIAPWALSFIGFRVAYLAAYVANASTLRSLVWTGGLVCCIRLFFL